MALLNIMVHSPLFSYFVLTTELGTYISLFRWQGAGEERRSFPIPGSAIPDLPTTQQVYTAPVSAYEHTAAKDLYNNKYSYSA
jgi:hypothetical protein